MKTRKIRSLTVSEIGLGCNNFGRTLDQERSTAVIEAALDLGINFFDTANVYGDSKSEGFMAEAFGPRRKDVVIATKFGHDRAPRYGHKAGGAPETVRESLDNSLRELRTDYIDLYYLHRPDPQTPIADTLGALLEARQAGKVLEVGCSEFTAEQLREADKASSDIHFAAVQNEYSLLNRKADAEVIPLCAAQDMAMIPWFPLMSGLLTGKYRKGQPAPADSRLGRGGDFAYVYTERNMDMAEELALFSEARGRTVLELAVSWLLARPEIASVIAGATRPEQVSANAAAGSWVLSPEELAEVDRITLR